METHQVCESLAELIDEQPGDSLALDGADLGDGYTGSPASTSSDISNSDTSDSDISNPDISDPDISGPDISGSEFRSDSHDSVNFKSPIISETEFRSQSPSPTEFRSQSPSPTEFRSQSQSSNEFGSQSQSSNELGSQSQSSTEFRSQSQSSTEFRSQSSETQSLNSAEWSSENYGLVHLPVPEDSSDHLSDTSDDVITQNSPPFSVVPSSNFPQDYSQQTDVGISRDKTVNLDATCNTSEDSRSDSSYFGDNESGDRDWLDLESASSFSTDLPIGEQPASCETESDHSSPLVSHPVPQPVSHLANKIDGCGDVPMLSVFKELSKEVEDSALSAPYSPCRGSNSTNPKTKLYLASRVRESRPLQSRAENPYPDASFKNLQTKEDVAIADVASSSRAIMLDSTLTIKPEPINNGTFDADDEDWKPCADTDSVSTVYCDPENCSTEGDLRKRFAVASEDDLTDLDSIVPSGQEDNASLTKLSEQYQNGLDMSSCTDFHNEPIVKSREIGKNVTRQWMKKDLSLGDTVTTRNPSAQCDHTDTPLELDHKVEDHVRVNHIDVIEESSSFELKNVPLINGVTQLAMSRQSLTDEGFVSQLSVMSCDSDLPLPQQNQKDVPHLDKECVELTEITELSTTFVEWSGCNKGSAKAMTREPDTRENVRPLDEGCWDICVSMSDGICKSLQPPVFHPADVSIIAHQLASSSIVSAISDLTSEWNLIKDVNTEILPKISQLKINTVCCEEDKLLKETTPHLESLFDIFKEKSVGSAVNVSEDVSYSGGVKVNSHPPDALGCTLRRAVCDESPQTDRSATFHWQAHSLSVYRMLPAVTSVNLPTSQPTPSFQAGEQCRLPQGDKPCSNEVEGGPSQNLLQNRLFSIGTKHHLEFFEIRSRRFSTYERLVPAVDELGELYVVDRRDKSEAEHREQTSTHNNAKSQKKKMFKGPFGSSKKKLQYGIYIFRPPQRYPDEIEGGICMDSSLSDLVLPEIPSTEAMYDDGCRTSTDYVDESINNDTNNMSNIVAGFTRELITQALRGIVRNVRSHPGETAPEQPLTDSSRLSHDCLDEQSELKQHVLDNAQLRLEEEIVQNVKEMSSNITSSISSATDLSLDCAMFADLVMQKAKAKVERELQMRDETKRAGKVPKQASPDTERTKICEDERPATQESSSLYLFNESTDSSLGSLLASTELENMFEPTATCADPLTSNTKLRCHGLSSSIFNLQPICSPFPQPTAVYDSRWWIERPYPQTRSPSCPFLPNRRAESHRYRLLIEPQDYLPLGRQKFEVPVCLEEVQNNPEGFSQLNDSSAQGRYARQYYSRKIQCSLCKRHKPS